MTVRKLAPGAAALMKRALSQMSRCDDQHEKRPIKCANSIVSIIGTDTGWQSWEDFTDGKSVFFFVGTLIIRAITDKWVFASRAFGEKNRVAWVFSMKGLLLYGTDGRFVI